MSKASSSHSAMLPRTLLTLFDRLLTRIEKLVLGLAICAIFVAMFLISADALGRYLFNKPVFFTVDLVSYFLLPVIMLMSAGLVLRRAGHISVDLFASKMPLRFYQSLAGLALAAAIPIFGVMTYRVGFNSLESFEQGKVAMGIVPWPLWIEHAIYATAMGLMTLRLFHMAMANITAAITGESDIGISMIHSHDSPLEESV